jgi:ubiquinone/menaquinone biosynthesis C-methylase UbiE
MPQYEQWFEDNVFAYESELKAVAAVMPKHGRGLEVGVGTGLFAARLGIKTGIDPSATMLEKAAQRGIEVYQAVGEDLPFPDNTFEYVVMVTSICFFDDLNAAFTESYRVLVPGGVLVAGFVDKDSPLGQIYQLHKNENVFYRDAQFYSTPEIHRALERCGFTVQKTVQTVFGELSRIKEVQEPAFGYGEGGFVATAATTATTPTPTTPSEPPIVTF